MVCCVYMLKGYLSGRRKLYVGKTEEFERRLNEHLSGKSKYTAKLKKITPVYLEFCKSSKEMARREMELKRLKPAAKIKLIKSESNKLSINYGSK